MEISFSAGSVSSTVSTSASGSGVTVEVICVASAFEGSGNSVCAFFVAPAASLETDGLVTRDLLLKDKVDWECVAERDAWADCEL